MATAPASVYEAKKGFQNISSQSKASLPVINWQSSGLNLQALHGLAASLNPGDKELTPVQAWFELASRYDLALLLKKRVLDNLRREFVGVVRCVCFGAMIEREAFESIVGRVMAPELASPAGSAY